LKWPLSGTRLVIGPTRTLKDGAGRSRFATSSWIFM